MARGNALDRLSQSARRLRTFENEAQWSRALVDATEGFCERAAVFAINRDQLELKAARGFTTAIAGPVPLVEAAAFLSAAESRDSVVAVASRRELSQPIAEMIGEGPDRRFSLFPLYTTERVAAILYADSPSGKVDSSALELLANFGGAVLEARATSPSRARTLLDIKSSES